MGSVPMFFLCFSYVFSMFFPCFLKAIWEIFGGMGKSVLGPESGYPQVDSEMGNLSRVQVFPFSYAFLVHIRTRDDMV
jgi:hypothetical protein